MKEQIEKFMQDMQGSEPRKGGKVLHKEGGAWMIFDKFEGNLAWCYCPTQGYVNIDREEIGEFKNTISIGDVLNTLSLTFGFHYDYDADLGGHLLSLWGEDFTKSFDEIFNECEWEDAGNKCDHVVCNDVGYHGGCQLQVPVDAKTDELFKLILNNQQQS